MLQLFQHYSGITDKSRKIRLYHRFSYFWPWSRNNYVMIPTTWQFPVNFTPDNYTSKLIFEEKKFRFLKGVSGSVSKSENNHFGMSDGFFFFFCVKKLTILFFGVNLPDITVMLQSFQHYFGIKVKNRKNRIFHRFSYFWPWSRNNYVLTPITW